MRILHFTGEGKGFMLGITEYVIVTDETEEESPVEDWRSLGFALESQTEIEELPSSFPLNTTLVPHGK